MLRSISIRMENPAEPMIPDVSTAIGTDSKFTTSLGYFRLIKFSIEDILVSFILRFTKNELSTLIIVHKCMLQQCY